MAKSVFITGATSGFGEATARRFSSEGWNVVISGRRTDRLNKLKAELKGPCHVVTLDVTDRAAVEAAFNSLPAPFSPVDVLVNNAGLAVGLEPADAVALDDWDAMVDTNIKGLMYCTRACLPQMVANGYGAIVNLGSVAGAYPYPGGNVYGATKAFVHQFSLNLRADLVGKNIHVTDVAPGLANTEFSQIRFKGDKDKADAVYKGVDPIRAEDVAETIFWVATRPANININSIEIMAGCQAFAPFNVVRKG
jgi:3-hydroxy acid dehydrogenase / malonic semialdehyde reductase